MENRSYSLRLFGTAALEAGGKPVTGRAVQRRRLAILSLLALAPKQTVSRDKLISMLWPDSDTDQARHLLSDSLYILNKSLGKDALITTGDDVRLNAAAVWCDVVEFQNQLHAGRPEEAVAVYAGPLLDGVFLAESEGFERWIETERDRLARAYAHALEQLATQAARNQDAHSASLWWRRRAALDPYDSRVALAFVKALAAADDRAGALQHARIHTTLLREEVGISASTELSSFVETLRAQPESSEPVRRVEIEPALVAADEPEPKVHPVPNRSRAWRRAMIAAIAIVMATALFALVRRRAAAAALPTRTVLVASIEGADSTLALAIKEALRAELESSPRIRVVSDAAVREGLRLMRLPATTPVTLPIAIDIAHRRGASIVVSGSAARIGRGVQLVAQLLAVPPGTPLATFTERPPNEDEVLRAVGKLAESIRARVLSVPVDTVPTLPAVSTSSLDALRYYVRARQIAGRGEAAAAAELAEAALIHDSLFALAHYLAADQLWYIDQQRHSNEHMKRAYELSATLPPRERLIVRARYEQLVRDEPDSALVYWRLLARSYPDEVMAYEGMRWAYRALGEIELMAAAAESAYHRDASQRDRYVADKATYLMMHGDSAAAFDLAKTHGRLEWATSAWAETRHDWPAALRLMRTAGKRHYILLALGRSEEAYRMLADVKREWRAQDAPRALLLQARYDAEFADTRARARTLLREAIAWLENADLSPPTYARFAERMADVAARIGDEESLNRVHALIRKQDDGQQLRSYRMAFTTIAAARAYLRGDMSAAAGLAAQALPGMFYGRSVSTILMLEADARAAAGEAQAADSLYRLVIRGGYREGDGETHAVLRGQARVVLRKMIAQN